MLFLTLLLLYFFLFIGSSCGQLHMHTYLFSLFVFFFWQSKHMGDTFSTHPILLDELKLKVNPSPSHAFLLPRVTMFLFLFFYVFLSSFILFFLFYFFLLFSG